MEAISASDRTTKNMPTQAARNTHIPPAVPPFVNMKAMILVDSQLSIEKTSRYFVDAYTRTSSQLAPIITE